MKHPVGRPTKYNTSFNEVAIKYIEQNIPENMSIPTMEGLALLLNVDTDTLGRWANNYEEFCGTIKRLKEAQKNHLMVTGLFGGKEINSTMAIFLLKANHNMVEKGVMDLNMSGNVTINMDELIGLSSPSGKATGSNSSSSQSSD